MTGRTARVTFDRAEQVCLELLAHLVRRDLLEVAGEEVPGVVDQDVDAAEPVDGGLRRRVRIVQAGDVQLGDQQILGRPVQSLLDLLGAAAGGDDLVAGRQRLAGDISAQAASSTGDENDLAHEGFLPGAETGTWKGGDRSGLVGGHDPQFADGGVPGAGDHVGDAVGDVLRRQDLGLLVEGVDHLVADLGLVVRAQFGRHATGLDDTDAHVPPGDFLAQGLGESVHAELGEAVDAVAVPGDAAGDRREDA